MLHGRVLKILEVFMLTKSHCATELGVTHKTFAGYLQPKGEHKLWQYLPKFLEWYPRLSRQWVYFGEGPMLIGHGVPLSHDVPLPAIAEAVDSMVKDACGTEANVYRYICGIPIPEREYSTGHVEHVRIARDLSLKQELAKDLGLVGTTSQDSEMLKDALREITNLTKENRILREQLEAAQTGTVPFKHAESAHL